MNALEALSRLIAMGDELTGLHPDHRPANADNADDLTAIAACQAILNTALPIARFRLHVELFGSKTDFTVSAVTIRALRGTLMNLRNGDKNQEVQATLWEQRQTGAEMLSGFRGFTRAANYKLWLKQIEDYQHATSPTVIPELPVAQGETGEGEQEGAPTEDAAS